MATITVRNLSEEAVSALKNRARRHARSMEAEAREVLTLAAIETGGSGLESRLAGELITQRRSVSAREVAGRISRNPPPEVDTRSWLADSRGDDDSEDFSDPWGLNAPA